MDHKYKIIKVIATGGMATIYKAEQVSLSRMVVIKKLHPHLASDIELVKRFEREAKILGRLNHKNIVEIIDFYKKNGDYFIVLEYVDGKSLRELLKEAGSLPLHIANFIILEIASGLLTAHKSGILHRDIKPGNIMIGNNGIIKISDFGLALALEGTEITEPGVTIGTPAYLPPELIKGKKATPRSDIYSLGILFYEIVTGRNPFKGTNRYETINNILYKKLPPIQLKQDSKNKDISIIITKMTRSNPKTRYENIDSVVRDLTPHTTANQDNLIKFLSTPEESEYAAEIQRRFSSGIFV
ncbi:MAG: serine/threonine protein kinase, partial [Candidatus Cloacimonadota bacterium]